MTSLNETHDPALRSWVDSANPASSDFPIQNRPFTVFRRQSSNEAFRGGVAIGDQILDLAAVASAGVFSDEAAPAVQGQLAACLVPQSGAEYGVPARIGDYTDFYPSVHHATSIGVSGQAFSRPLGQTLPPGTTQPIFGPSKRLDMELELGIFVVTGTGNGLGEAVAMGQAEDHVFGLCLLNDWSARDIQLQVGLQTPTLREAGQGDTTICRTSYRHAYPTLRRIGQACLELPAFERASPEAPVDAT